MTDEQKADELAAAVVTLLEGWIDLKVTVRMTEERLKTLPPDDARQASEAIAASTAVPLQATRDLLRRTLRTAFLTDTGDGNGDASAPGDANP